MNLLSSQAVFWPWFIKVLVTFLKARPLATAVIILTTLLERVTNLLSVLLPLKVILLAGSEGVPRYFAFFIDTTNKEIWIAILSFATVGMFIATSLLDTISRRISQWVSGEVLESANEISVIADQEQKASSYYSRFCSIVSYSIFFILSLVVLWFINLYLFLFLLLLIFSEIVFTAIAVLGNDDINPGRLKGFIINKLSNYLGTLKIINFLLGFFVILYPYFVGVDYNILFAIVSMILLRQSLNMLSSLVSDAVLLSKARHRVNTLVFRGYQLENKERPLSVALRDIFPNHRRERMVAEHIDAEKKSKNAEIKSLWVDSLVPSAKTFIVTFSDESVGSFKNFQQQVFPPNSVSRLNNESFLFEHVSRLRLKAPEVITRFSEGPFECILYHAGIGEAISGSEWRKCEFELLKDILSCQPPKSLVEAYSMSHPMLYNKIKDEFVSRVEVAIDTEAEAEVLAKFKSVVADLIRYLSKLPVYIYNPDIRPGNVIKEANDGGFLVMTWTRWQILPLGAAISSRYKPQQLEEALLAVRENRRDVADTFSVEDMSCANLCYELERAIRTERYKAALDIMHQLLDCNYLYTDKPALPGERNE